jgi:hypothetical protein
LGYRQAETGSRGEGVAASIAAPLVHAPLAQAPRVGAPLAGPPLVNAGIGWRRRGDRVERRKQDGVIRRNLPAEATNRQP